MAKVQILPQVLAHQIAAGEIVERPASVVKELVENSLDAGASSISVIVERGGAQLIRVSDDGFGMSADDARLAFEHHATSKISSLDDLSRITTLGFRGEALPSIASVSRTLLRTTERVADSGAISTGTEVSYEGGQLKEIREISWPRGTEIIVEDLFFNVPARRKFLKTVSTELSHVSRVVMSYALVSPAVEFHLEHQGKQLVDASAVSDLTDRVFQLFGEEVVNNLVRLDYERDGVRVTGFTSLPHEQRNSSSSLHLYVNRRMVRDKVLTHAIRMAYRDLIPSQAYPFVVLFVDLDPVSIDVNVHPTKVEIRFRQSQQVHSAIFHGIEKALLLNQTNLTSLARDVPFSSPKKHRPDGVKQSLNRFFNRTPTGSKGFNWRGGTADPWRPMDSTGTTSAVLGHSSLDVAGDDLAQTVLANKSASPHGDEIPETAHLRPDPSILGQFVESFVVVADREGVMLIDQHVAHERILYDKALRSMESGIAVSVQRLLMPVTLTLTAQQRAIAEQIIDHLNANGFDVEWFGSETLLVRGVPALASHADAGKIVEDLLAELENFDGIPQGEQASDRSLRRLRQRIAISLSCRAAIKINTPLSEEKMNWLLDELFKCDNPYTCPHGRPIVLRLDIGEILRGFKRI